MKCGLLGEKLCHSYSPQIHGYLADYSYSLFEIAPMQLDDFLRNGDFGGINVTIPYKKAVIPYCAELSDRAQTLGAVNTIVRRSDGSLIGHNTDYFGFYSMLKNSGVNVTGKKVLVLGSGGASSTAVSVLKELGAIVVVISRNGENNYTNLHIHSDASVIVNATPVGMYPNVGESLVDLSAFEMLEGVLDVVYNPAKTNLLMDAEARGLVAMNGLWMLVAQAKESAEWFSGNAIDDSLIEKIYKKLKLQMENTILIGMPGCGKSTIGKLVAQRLNKTFVDTDEVIIERTGMTIPQFFEQNGEASFRKVETSILAELGKCSGLVIATGGGCVTQERNYTHLHQNGTIYWIQRDLSLLATDGRPLSQSDKLSEMYHVRFPLYERFSDHIICNNADITAAANAICQKEVLK